MSRPRSPGLSTAALAVVFGLAACKQTEPNRGAPADAAAAADGADDASPDGVTDAPDADARAAPPCRVGGTRADVPTTIGCPSSVPGRLVVAGDFVYWTVQGPGAIVVRAPLVGGAGEELVRDDAGAFGLAVDGQFVYYGQPGAARIMRIPLSGGLPVTLAGHAGDPLFLVKDGASLYWTDAGVDGKVVKLDLVDGAQPVTLIDGQSRPRALAVRDGFVYWTDVIDGTLLRTPDHLTGPPDAAVRTASRLASGLGVTIGGSPSGPTDLLLVGDYAYVPDGHGFIRRVPLAGGDLEPVADAQGTPYGIATDGVSIYWSTLGIGGGIFKAPLEQATPDGGGAPFTLVYGDQPDPHFVAVTADNVYWTVWGARPAVARIAK
ncbi:MAG TPA: hypothetical protein VHL80_12565 [Polyangia bacterium]|nr:hypothetical protein [Polyangia bacterium]